MSGLRDTKTWWRRGAFSLLELILVLTIMGILAGAAVVATSGRRPRESVAIGASDAACSLRTAMERARITGLPHRIILLHGAGSTSLRTEALENGVWTAAPGLAGRAHQMPSGVRCAWKVLESNVQASEPVFTSDPGAMGQIGAAWSLHVVDDGNSEERWVLVRTGSGQVTVSDVAPERV